MSKIDKKFPDESEIPIIINGNPLEKSSSKPIVQKSENLSPGIPKSSVRPTLPQKAPLLKLEDTMASVKVSIPQKISRKLDQSHKLDVMKSLSQEPIPILISPLEHEGEKVVLNSEKDIPQKVSSPPELKHIEGESKENNEEKLLPQLLQSEDSDLYIELNIEDLNRHNPPTITEVPKVSEVPKVTEIPKAAEIPETPGVPKPTKKIITKKVKKIVKKEESMRPDYSKMSEKEQSIYRINFKNKFELLRKWYPTLSIPERIEDNQDLDYIHSVYEVCIKFMYSQINSSFYRGILLLSWLGLEFAGTMWLGLDVAGYCQQQMSLLWIYEPLIDELSQVNFESVTSGWSPFQKIVGLVLGSFALMVIIRMVMNKIGDKVGMNLSGFTETITNFFANMFVPKQADVSKLVSPSDAIGKVTGLGSIPISPPPRAAQTQVGMAEDALKMYNIMTGKSTSSQGSPPPPPSAQPAYPQPPQTTTTTAKSKTKKPSFDS